MTNRDKAQTNVGKTDRFLEGLKKVVDGYKPGICERGGSKQPPSLSNLPKTTLKLSLYSHF